MNHRYPRTLILSILLASAFGTLAHADAPTHLPPIHADPGLTDINKKGDPLPFKAYELKDPATGAGNESHAKPIPATATLTLPNGKKVKAGDYFDGLNKFEKFVTPYGYTLRTPGDEVIPFSHVHVDQDEIERQRRNTLGAHDSNNIRIRPVLGDVQIKHATAAQNAPILKKAVDDAVNSHAAQAQQPKTFSASKSWSDAWGWSNKFAAFVDASLTVKGSSTQTSSTGTAEAGGYMFGDKLDIVKGTVDYVTPKEGNVNGDTAFYFVGFKLFSYNYNNSDVVFYNTEWSKGLDESTTIDFAIGPIPMSATLGAHGSASMDFRMDLLPLHANADFVPALEVDVYMQVGVDVVVAGAGGGSDLVLITDSLPIVGMLQINNGAQGPYFDVDISANDNLSALNGSVYAYAYVYVPAWNLPPWKKKQWNWTLFKINGISATGSIFSDNLQENLF